MAVASIASDLARLGVKRMLLAIHDVSFPSDANEDVGRGSPATRAAERLYAYAASLGFTGIQLGPQGQTSRDNPSPYDGTIFSRHLGTLSLHSLRAGGPFAGLVDDALIDGCVWPATPRVDHRRAYDAMHELVAAAHAALVGGARPDLRARLAAFRVAHAAWLDCDALYAALSLKHDRRCFRDWPADERDLWLVGDLAHARRLAEHHALAIDRFAFGQFLVHEEHARVRAMLPDELALYGDLQVGYSDRDAWAHAAAFLRDYRMGAPPSRTNPEGQPWGYPVLDPDQYRGRAGDVVAMRADKSFAEYDSLRIDHPHGLICPWVYLASESPAEAVRSGARLFESPDVPEHPFLARFAIPRPSQIDRTQPRHADHWVTDLDAAQIERFAALFDILVESARRHGRAVDDLSCEVLSTMPRPLGDVLAKYELGRWRITQKGDLDKPADVYRAENAGRHDWVMLGNHDTAPVFSLLRSWAPEHRERWGRHLAAKLRLDRPERLAQPGFFASAMLGELFLSPAENVSIFFADLFGETDRFNVPGLLADENWSLRLPADFEAMHAERIERSAALDIRLALDLALAAKQHRAERR